MLLVRQWNQFQSSSSELHNQKLTGKNTDYDQNKQVIVSNISTNVNITLFQLSGIEKVEHL